MRVQTGFGSGFGGGAGLALILGADLAFGAGLGAGTDFTSSTLRERLPAFEVLGFFSVFVFGGRLF